MTCPNGSDFEVKEEYKKYYIALHNFHRWLKKDIRCKELSNKMAGCNFGLEGESRIFSKLIEIEKENGVEAS